MSETALAAARVVVVVVVVVDIRERNDCLAKTPWCLVGNGGMDPYCSPCTIPNNENQTEKLPASSLNNYLYYFGGSLL